MPARRFDRKPGALADLGVVLEEYLVGVLRDILCGIWSGRGPALGHEDLHLADTAGARDPKNLVGLIARQIADHVEHAWRVHVWRPWRVARATPLLQILGHARQCAGRHRPHPDIVTAALQRQHAGEAGDAGFRRAVVGLAEVADQARTR